MQFCYVVVSLLRKIKTFLKPTAWKKARGKKRKLRICSAGNREIYNHSGDDGKEDPPVPIPNTEVKLFYAESTCRLLPGG